VVCAICELAGRRDDVVDSASHRRKCNKPSVSPDNSIHSILSTSLTYIRSDVSACRNLALDLVLQVSVSRKQTELSAQVRDNVSNAILASVKLPGKFCSCILRSAKAGAPGSLLANINIRICVIAAYANLDTCALDVKDGYCGICYQSLLPAVAKKASEECAEFCKHLGTQGCMLHYLFGLHAHRP